MKKVIFHNMFQRLFAYTCVRVPTYLFVCVCLLGLPIIPFSVYDAFINHYHQAASGSVFIVPANSEQFKQKDKRKTTWIHFRSGHWHMIEFITTRCRDNIAIHCTGSCDGTNCVTYYRHTEYDKCTTGKWAENRPSSTQRIYLPSPIGRHSNKR